MTRSTPAAFLALARRASSFGAFSCVFPLLLASAAGASPVLNNDGTLMTTTHLSRTARQDTLPLWWNRGTDLEGAVRFGGDVPASPGFNSGMGAATMGGIELASLGFSMSEVDMALPTNGPAVVIGRSFNHRQGSDTSVAASNGLQGYNWFQSAMPEIELFAGLTNDLDVIYLVYGANRFMEFKRTALNATTFRGRNGATGIVEFVAGGGGTPYDTYTITDQNGWSWVFWGGNTASHKADWQLWKKSDPQGLTVYAGHKTTHSSAVTNGYATGGGISTLYQEFGDPGAPTERRYLFTYTTVGTAAVRTSMTASCVSATRTPTVRARNGTITSRTGVTTWWRSWTTTARPRRRSCTTPTGVRVPSHPRTLRSPAAPRVAPTVRSTATTPRRGPPGAWSGTRTSGTHRTCRSPTAWSTRTTRPRSRTSRGRSRAAGGSSATAPWTTARGSPATSSTPSSTASAPGTSSPSTTCGTACSRPTSASGCRRTRLGTTTRWICMSIAGVTP